MEPDYALIESISTSEIARAGERFGLSPGRRRFLFSGRFIPEKRVDILLAAFAAIADARPAWDLVLLGSGPLKEEVKSLAPQAISQRLIWIDSLRDPREVFAVYH